MCLAGSLVGALELLTGPTYAESTSPVPPGSAGSLPASASIGRNSSSSPSVAISTPMAPSSVPSRAIALPANIIRLPLVRQATDYTCGIGALQSVLAYYGSEFREDELASTLKSDRRKGTAYQRIADFAHKQGFDVSIQKGMSLDELKSKIDKRLPVICLLQAWSKNPQKYASDWVDGHYAVVTGYDHKNIYFMDPSTLGNFAYVPKDEFLKRWHDTDGKEKLVHFGMIISRGNAIFTPDVCMPMD